MPYDQDIDIWPFVLIMDNGAWIYLENGAIRRLSNFEIGYYRDERKVRTIHLEGKGHRPVTVSKHVFGLE